MRIDIRLKRCSCVLEDFGAGRGSGGIGKPALVRHSLDQFRSRTVELRDTLGIITPASLECGYSDFNLEVALVLCSWQLIGRQLIMTSQNRSTNNSMIHKDIEINSSDTGFGDSRSFVDLVAKKIDRTHGGHRIVPNDSVSQRMVYVKSQMIGSGCISAKTRTMSDQCSFLDDPVVVHLLGQLQSNLNSHRSVQL